MKKLICMILALIMVMGLCACGEGATDNGRNNSTVSADSTTGNNSTTQQPEGETQETTVPPEPTSEEKSVLENYVNTVAWLNSAAAELKAAPYFNGDNIQKYRTELLELDLNTVSKWAETEWAEWAYEKCYNPEDFSFPADFDCNAVLARFVKVEDVKLRYTETTTDSLGNVSGPREETDWHYFANGTLRHVGHEFSADRLAIESVNMTTSFFNYHTYSANLREYDADGRLTKISYYDTYQGNSKVALVRLFAYDAAGKLTTQTAKSNNGELVYNYNYDDQGRLAKVETVFDAGLYTKTYEVLYTYDANGNLTKGELTIYNARSEVSFIAERHTMEYVYDASGKLVSGTYTDQDWGYNIAQGNFLNIQKVDQYTFELDAQGRVVKEIVIPGASMWAQRNEEQLPAPYAQIVYETVYGDYYVYMPAE